ncbi:VENN motif pre-toxin domain-containing protein, partial [Avibacterium avium]|uniref:VENN motif pre-toxin domain-containing protein n=2 Tax=Avibacterium avium TaxID=751 RepID=UPI003BF80B52
TKNANEQVQKQDLQKVQEQQEMAKVIGEIVDNGISIATFEKREALNKLSLEKFQAEERYGKDSPQAKALGTQMQALQQQLDQEFGLGSEKGMAIRAVTAALQSAVQQDKAGAITALASPYLNREIHKLTEGDSTKEKAANLMAHALLSAVEFQVTGKDPLTGAMAGVTGEATAQYLTKALYNKAPSELTANEKETISSLSQLAGGLAGAFTAKANGSGEKQGGSFLSGVAGAETAKRAVENNNFFNYTPTQLNDMAERAKGKDLADELENKAKREVIDRGAPHYVVIEGTLYKVSGKLIINTRNGEIFIGGGANPISMPSQGGLSFSSQVGWITNLSTDELDDKLSAAISETLKGKSIGGTACYGIACVSSSKTILTDKPKYLFGVGIGGGFSIGADRVERVSGE